MEKSEGFAIAPILYLLGLIGVGAGVLFSGYSQILRSNQTMSNTLASKNDLQGTATTLAASSWLATNGQTLCPPMIGTNASANCTGAAGAIYIGTSFANANAANLPSNYASVSLTGAPVEYGVFKAGSGAKVLDPWGHYYLYCRWENNIGTANALMVISAGANGKTETKCGDTVAGGDDLFVVWTTAVTQNRAAVWQTTTSGTSVTGAQFGATGSQINVDVLGNLTVPGALAVTGSSATTVGTGGLSVSGLANLSGGVSSTSGSFASGVTASTGSFASSLNVSGTSTLSGLSAGTATLSALSVTGNTAVGGTLGVTGASTLGSLSAGTSTLAGLSVSGPSSFSGVVNTSNTAVNIGTSYAATGSSMPLLTVGKPVGSPASYPFSVDQFGAVTGSNFTGNLNGNQSGGSVSATTLAASGAATLSNTLAVTGATTLTGQLNGTNAIFSGNVQAGSFTGTMTLGGGGVTLSGVIPISNGGTGQTSAGSALAGLFAGAGPISQMIPGADIVNNSITSTQLDTTGVTAGTYSSVTVGADGRVTSGVASAGVASSIGDGSGDSITIGTSGGIVYTIGSSVQGNWTTTGLMVGSSKTALDKLDVYGGVAIGTGYAGTTAAPTNGLLVQGNVAIGTTISSGALTVNGTISAGAFVGSGAGLTSIGTGSISGTLGTGNGGTGTSTTFTQGSVVYAGAGGVYSQDNASFFYDASNHRLGLGTAAPTATLAVNGTTSFMPGADYTTSGNQSDVNLGSASTVRYNGSGAATFYGIIAGVDGQLIHLHNASANVLTLANLSSSEGTAVNQIITGSGADLTIQGNSSVMLQYDMAASKWRVIGGPGGGPGLAGQAAYYQTSGSMAIGTSSMYFVGGNVGIGTAAPSTLLHVNGTLHLGSVAGSVGSTGGTGIVGGASGQVQFNSGGNSFAGDSNLYWDNSNKFLGVGTTIPAVPLQVNGAINSVNDNVLNPIANITYGSAYYPGFRGKQARGSLTSPTAVQSGDVLANFDGYGYDGSGFNTQGAGMKVVAGSTWTGTSTTRNGYLTFWTTGSGTPAERVRIDNSGNVGIGVTNPQAPLSLNAGTVATTTNLIRIDATNTNPSTGNSGTTVAQIGIGPGIDIGGNSLTGGGLIFNLSAVDYQGNPTSTYIFQGPTAANTINFMNGYIGIGTTSPNNPLDIGKSGGIHITSGTPGSTSMALYNNAGTLTWNGLPLETGGGTISGTPNYLPVFTGTSTLGNSVIYQNGSNVGIGTTTPGGNLDVRAAVDGHFQVGSNSDLGSPTVSVLSRSDSNAFEPLEFAASKFNFTGGNVGIGTTNPSTALQVNGTATATTFSGAHTGSGSGLTGIGTASLGGITGTASNTTYLRGDGTWGTVATGLTVASTPIASGTSTRVLYDNAGVVGEYPITGTGNVVMSASPTLTGTITGAAANFSGNVGIGTAAPSAVFDAYSPSALRVGYLRTTNTDIALPLTLVNSSVTMANGGQWALGINGSSPTTFPSMPSGSFWIHQDGTGAALTITHAGNVGIGTTAPAYNLDVAGTIRSSNQHIANVSGSQFRGIDSSYGWMAYSDASNFYILLTNSGNQYGSYNSLRPFYIAEATGGVYMANGLNVTGGGLTVAGTVTATTTLSGNVEQLYGNYIWPGRNDGSGANYQTSWYLASNSSYGLYSNTGLYLAGALTVASGANLTGRVNVTGPAGDWAEVINWGPGSVNGYGILVGTGSGKYSQFQNADGYYIELANGGWGVYSNGSAYFGGDSYGANFYHTSDRRLKDNIKPSKGLEIVDKLNGVTFTWKKDGKPSAGVIAQEVEAIMPEAVNTDSKGMKSVSYDTLIAPLLEAVKEVHAMVVALEQKFDKIVAEIQGHDERIAKLEAALAELKSANDASAKEIASLHKEIADMKNDKHTSGAKP